MRRGALVWIVCFLVFIQRLCTTILCAEVQATSDCLNAFHASFCATTVLGRRAYPVALHTVPHSHHSGSNGSRPQSISVLRAYRPTDPKEISATLVFQKRKTG